MPSEAWSTQIGWAVEYEPGAYVADRDGAVCVWPNESEAEEQAEAQKRIPEAWAGVRVVPVYAPRTKGADKRGTER